LLAKKVPVNVRLYKAKLRIIVENVTLTSDSDVEGSNMVLFKGFSPPPPFKLKIN